MPFLKRDEAGDIYQPSFFCLFFPFKSLSFPNRYRISIQMTFALCYQNMDCRALNPGSVSVTSDIFLQLVTLVPASGKCLGHSVQTTNHMPCL